MNWIWSLILDQDLFIPFFSIKKPLFSASMYFCILLARLCIAIISGPHLSMVYLTSSAYLPLESLRARPHKDRRPPLFDKPHSAWPSSPTLNSSPRNQAGKVLTPHSPHLSPLASLEGWELAKDRISRALCYNPVSHGPWLVQERVLIDGFSTCQVPQLTWVGWGTWSI